jgi:ribosomal protein S18 acetylase RimI-like enzyme
VDALHREHLPQVFQEPTRIVRSEAHIDGIIAGEKAALFVAETGGPGGQIVGLVQVEICDSPDVAIFVPRRFGRIADIAVSRDWQRGGVGRLLAERAHEWIVEQGAIEVELTVWEFNQEAIAFYERLGYSTARRTMWRTLGPTGGT